MTVKRPIVVLPALALLAACGGAPSDDSRSASGEVLEGTISDAMLPIDRVRSEPALEDPAAFARTRSGTPEAESADTPEDEDREAAGAETGEAAAAEPAGPDN